MRQASWHQQPTLAAGASGWLQNLAASYFVRRSFPRFLLPQINSLAVQRITQFDGLYGQSDARPDAEYLFSELLETRS